MNVPFAFAGALALIAALVHGALGEALVVKKLRTEALSPSRFGGPSMTLLMIRATWHITTIAFAVTGSALAVCAPIGPSDACHGVGLLGAVSYAGFATLTIGLALSGGRRIKIRHPAPLIFVLVAVLAWWGLGAT